MGLYSIANGCDNCSTVDSFTGNLNLSMDPNAAIVAGMAGMANPYGNQYKQYLTQAGYPAGGSAMVQNMGIGSTVPTTCNYPQQGQQYIAQPNIPNVATAAVAQQAAANAMAAAKVAEATANAAAVAATTSTMATTKQSDIETDIEGFYDGTTDSTTGKNWHKIMMKKALVYGLVVLSALACNECFKHFINRSLRMDESWPYLYILYPVVAILAVLITLVYLRKA